VTRTGRDLLRGAALALLAGVAALCIARFGLGRVYYLNILLPAALVAMLLVAWLIHLKADGFFGRGKPPVARDAEHPYAAFDEAVVPRRPGGKEAWGSGDVQRALVWAALLLALASVLLYHALGVGTRF
jgi:hypothetical protein